MSYNDEFEKRFDCDPADCNDTKNAIDEFDTESAQEFPLIKDPTPLYDSDVDNDAEAEKELLNIREYGIKQTASSGGVIEPLVTDPFDEMAATSDSDELYSTQTSALAEQRCALDDYEIISDVLGSEKQLVKLYSTALCESAEEGLRNIIRENLMECAADQYKTFEFMEKRGMYPTEQAEEEKIVQAKQQFQPLCKCNR